MCLIVDRYNSYFKQKPESSAQNLVKTLILNRKLTNENIGLCRLERKARLNIRRYCIRTCTHTHTHTYIYACMYVYVCVHVCKYAQIYSAYLLLPPSSLRFLLCIFLTSFWVNNFYSFITKQPKNKQRQLYIKQILTDKIHSLTTVQETSTYFIQSLYQRIQTNDVKSEPKHAKVKEVKTNRNCKIGRNGNQLQNQRLIYKSAKL